MFSSFFLDFGEEHLKTQIFQKSIQGQRLHQRRISKEWSFQLSTRCIPEGGEKVIEWYIQIIYVNVCKYVKHVSTLRVLIINCVRVHLCKWMSYQPPSTDWGCKLFLGTRNYVRNILVILRRELGPVMLLTSTSLRIIAGLICFLGCISLDFLFHYYLMWIIMIHIVYCELCNKMFSNLNYWYIICQQGKAGKKSFSGAKTWCKKDWWKI